MTKCTLLFNDCVQFHHNIFNSEISTLLLWVGGLLCEWYVKTARVKEYLFPNQKVVTCYLRLNTSGSLQGRNRCAFSMRKWKLNGEVRLVSVRCNLGSWLSSLVFVLAGVMYAWRSIILCHWPRLYNNLRESERAPSVAEDAPVLLRNDSPSDCCLGVTSDISRIFEISTTRSRELFTWRAAYTSVLVIVHNTVW